MDARGQRFNKLLDVIRSGQLQGTIKIGLSNGERFGPYDVSWVDGDPDNPDLIVISEGAYGSDELFVDSSAISYIVLSPSP